jgi:hypothetical protein
MGGGVPFGYRLDNRRLYIDPKEADIVRQIITGNASLTSQTMRSEIPELWTDQMETFLGKREPPGKA